MIVFLFRLLIVFNCLRVSIAHDLMDDAYTKLENSIVASIGNHLITRIGVVTNANFAQSSEAIGSIMDEAVLQQLVNISGNPYKMYTELHSYVKAHTNEHDLLSSAFLYYFSPFKKNIDERYTFVTHCLESVLRNNQHVSLGPLAMHDLCMQFRSAKAYDSSLSMHIDQLYYQDKSFYKAWAKHAPFYKEIIYALWCYAEK